MTAVGPGVARPRLLVVDDDEGLNRLLCRRLTEAGYEARGVLSGAEALTAIEQERFALLLLDYLLPDTDARQFVGRLREAAQDVPFVVMTGRGDERVAVEMMRLGARDYVTKQVDFVELMLEVVAQTLRGLARERALVENERLLARAQQIGRLGHWQWDVAGGTLVWSEELYRLFGVAPGFPLTYEAILERLHPEDRDRNNRWVKTLLEAGDSSVIEFRLVRPDGEVRHIHQQAEVTRDRNGRAWRVFGIMQDITERKRDEERLYQAGRALEAERDRLRSVLDNLPDLVYIVERDYRLRYVNPALELANGSPGSRPCFEYFHGRAEPCPGCHNEQVFAGQAVRSEYETKQGRIYEVIDTPLRNPDGSVSKLGILHDVTEARRNAQEVERHRRNLQALVDERTRELRAAQEQLLMQERLATLGRVAGSIAHELRNPLAVVRNASYYLQETARGRLQGRPLRHLEVIDEYVERANRAITTILDFTQARPTRPVRVSVRTLLDRAVVDAALPPGVDVLLDVQRRLPEVWVDDQQLTVVFRNLLTNAAQAMPHGGTVKVCGWRAPGQVVVSVTDCGEGIAPEYVPRVFEPLFTTRRVGVGLGLAICRAFVEVNRGTIAIESELGKGTTVTLTLPVVDCRTPAAGSTESGSN